MRVIPVWYSIRIRRISRKSPTVWIPVCWHPARAARRTCCNRPILEGQGSDRDLQHQNIENKYDFESMGVDNYYYDDEEDDSDSGQQLFGYRPAMRPVTADRMTATTAAIPVATAETAVTAETIRADSG